MHSLESLMRLDALRHLYRGFYNVLKGTLIKAGCLRLLTPLGELVSLPLVGETAAAFEFRVLNLLNGRLVVFALLELVLKVCSGLVDDLLVLCVLHGPLSYDFFGIRLRHRLHAADHFVHLGLGECGLIDLVVPILSEPDHVKEHVLAELLPVPHCELANSCYGLHIMRIHPNDRSTKRLHYV